MNPIFVHIAEFEKMHKQLFYGYLEDFISGDMCYTTLQIFNLFCNLTLRLATGVVFNYSDWCCFAKIFVGNIFINDQRQDVPWYHENMALSLDDLRVDTSSSVQEMYAPDSNQPQIHHSPHWQSQFFDKLPKYNPPISTASQTREKNVRPSIIVEFVWIDVLHSLKYRYCYTSAHCFL